MIDAKVALIILFKDDALIDTLVSGRVYYDAETFQEEVQGMAQKCISLNRSGGPEDNGYLEVNQERIDIKCWGETAREAMRVYSAVQDFLKRFTPKMVSTPDGLVKLYNCSRSAGPLELRDPDAEEWPIVWSSWLVKSHMVETVAVSS